MSCIQKAPCDQKQSILQLLSNIRRNAFRSKRFSLMTSRCSLSSELWPVWKELHSCLKTRSAFYCICQALCWVCSFFFSDRGAVCKYYDGWLSGYAMDVLAQRGVSYAGSVWRGQTDNGGLHSSCLGYILLIVLTINFLGVQELNSN